MSLLKPATHSTAFLKLGIYGFEGAGKTFTATEIGAGICKRIKNNKIAFFDTEKGSDFHIDRLKAQGIQLFVTKSRSFVDALEVIKEAEKEKYGFLIFDSVTHLWRELVDSFLAEKERKIRYLRNLKPDAKVQVNLTVKDWQPLKKEWARFTDLFINSRVHIATCGRAGHEYDISVDEEDKQEVVKSGTKMKAEGEFGYESDLLIEMSRVPLSEITRNRKQKGFVNRAVILKDRTDKMNAVSIDKPKFKDFLPIINSLNIGGEHVGVDASRNSEGVFGVSGDSAIRDQDIKRAIALEQLESLWVNAGIDGTKQENKRLRTQYLEKQFGTASMTELEKKTPLHILEDGVKRIKESIKFAQSGDAQNAPL